MVKSHLDILYSAFQRAESRVGGGEGLVGIYGSMTQAGTCSIMGAMVQHTGMKDDSILVDIGSGLCRPLLHATVEYNVQQTYGVELDAVKCQKAVPFIQHTIQMCSTEDVAIPVEAAPKVICMSVEELGSLEPATHAYAAWEGFPVDAKQAIGVLFRTTKSLKAITIVQRSLRNEDPCEVMEDLGFGQVECKAAAIPVHMAGSGRKLNAYLFTKIEGQDKVVTRSSDSAHRKHNLITAPAFTAEKVLNDLDRMTSGASHEGCAAAAAETAAHGHGLRPRRGRTAMPTTSSTIITTKTSTTENDTTDNTAVTRKIRSTKTATAPSSSITVTDSQQVTACYGAQVSEDVRNEDGDDVQVKDAAGKSALASALPTTPQTKRVAAKEDDSNVSSPPKRVSSRARGKASAAAAKLEEAAVGKAQEAIKKLAAPVCDSPDSEQTQAAPVRASRRR